MALRIHVASDGHDDIRGNKIACEESFNGRADLIAYVGDLMAPGLEALRRLRELYPDYSIPLIYVPGNHDFYSDGDPKRPHLKTTIERQLREMPELADKLGIILLQDSVREFYASGMLVRAFGGTLWSNMQARPGYVSMNDAMREAGKRMNDYRTIKTGEGRSKDQLRPTETLAMHRETVRFVERVLSTPTDADVTLLCTHHAPSYRSLRGWDPEHPERFGTMDWCYASNCERWFTGEGMGPDHVAPDLAVHGHVHANKDYTIGETRIVANPRGYPLHALGMVGRENPHYDPQKVIELEPRYVPGMRI